VPMPPSEVGAIDPEPRKTYSAYDTATVRSRPTAAVHRDAGNNAVAGAYTTAGVGAWQPDLVPTTVPTPTADPEAPQAAFSAPKPQTSPHTAALRSDVAEQPLASPPGTSQPAASMDGTVPLQRDTAADSDAKAEPVTATVASIAPMPPLPAATSVQTPTIPASSTGTPHPTPAAQITPALVSMSHAPDGAQRLTMKLEPPELGQVHIRIDRPIDATPARVEITVERPETLQLLLRDQPQLQRALDQAGVPAEGRSITFHVTTPEPAARTETAMAPMPAGSSAAMGGDLSHSASRQGGRPMQPGTLTDASGVTDDNENFQAIAVTPTRWLRAGLDITA